MKTIQMVYAFTLLLFACSDQTDSTSTHSKDKNMSIIEKTTYNSGKNIVRFVSEGDTLVGHLYLPDSYKEGEKLPVVIVGGSWTTVKEQMAGLYASKLAEKGMAALAFDHRYYGESTGEPRYYENPSAKTRDFIRAMDFVHSLPLTDREKTGGLAICASGGYMAEAVAEDRRFRSLVMVVPWFNTDEITEAFYGGKEGISMRLNKSRQAKSHYEQTGEMTYVPTISKENSEAAMVGDFQYYLDKAIGNVPNWSDDKFALASWEPWLTYRPLSKAREIDVPVLIISSEQAATPGPSSEFYDILNGSKEIVWMDGGQLDFYYKPAQVNEAVAKATTYFTQTM